MKQLIITSLVLFVGMSGYAQRQVNVYVQVPSNDGKDYYYDGMYGVHTMLIEDLRWIEKKPDTFYSAYFDTEIEILKISDSVWENNTFEFINTVSSDTADNVLYVLAGHDVLLDTMPKVSYTGCAPNVLLGCMTDIWEGVIDNTLVNTTDFYAPEGYVQLAAIYAWLEGDNVRKKTAEAYAYYQKKNIYWSYRIHGYYD